MITPKPVDGVGECLFAYGSLIGSSADETACNVKIPASVAGLQRGWWAPVPKDGATGLGAIFQKNYSCNGVLVKSSDEYLVKTDAREIPHRYQRVKLPGHALNVMDDSLANVGDFWTYLIDSPADPTVECPIVQSYLDVVITGCLAIGEEFATEFILTTYGWENLWIDDRNQPRYRRSIAADAPRIDALLKRIIPKHFSKRT